MKQRSRKRLVAARASPNAKPEAAVRSLTVQDRAALRSISGSGLFTLEASRDMYTGVRRLRPVTNKDQSTKRVKP